MRSPAHVTRFRAFRMDILRVLTRGAAVAGLLSVALVSAACSSSTDTTSGGSSTSSSVTTSSVVTTSSSEATSSVAATSPETAAASETASSSSSAATSAATVAAIRDKLPPKIRDKGYIVVATDPSFGPPSMYNPAGDPNTFLGIDPDILRAIGAVLGVDIHFVPTKFEGVVTGVQSGRYDMGSNLMQDLLKRQDLVDMVTYFNLYQSFVVLKGNPNNIHTLADLCGKTVAAKLGHAMIDYLQDYSKTNCGGNDIKISTFPDQTGVLLALKTKRVQAMVASNDFIAGLTDGTNPEVVGIYEGLQDSIQVKQTPAAFAVAKDGGLAEPIKEAIDEIIRNGEYGKIMEKYQITGGAITQSQINAATQ